MKKRNKVALLISGICLLAGVICLVVGFFLGANPEQYKAAFVFTDTDFRELFIKDGIKQDSNVELSEKDWNETLFEGIEKLNIEFAAGELEVKTYDGNCIKLYTKKGDHKIKAEQQQDELSIRTKGEKWITKMSKGCEAVILVPKDLRFSQVELELDAASAVFSKLLAEKIEVEVDAGALTIDELDAKDAKVCCNAGTVTITLNATAEDYYFSGEVEAGELVYGEEEYAGLSCDDIRLGERKAKKELSAECNAGSIKFLFGNNK